MINTLQRIKKFIDYKGIAVRAFEQNVGMSNGSFASQLKNNKTIGVDKLENILNIYPEISPEWLLTGKGNMLKTSENKEVNQSIIGNNNKNAQLAGGSIVYGQSQSEIEEFKKQLIEKDKIISNLIKQQEKLINKLTK